MEKSILLVDDVQMYLEIAKDFLKYTGIRVTTARDGVDALEIIKGERPHMVFMDLQMPRMDGATCCRAIKSDPELFTIPVVLVTMKGRQEDEEACRAAGCDHFMTKPLDRDYFLDVTRRFIPQTDRREKRVATRIDGTFRAGGVAMPCTIRDLSAGGVFVETDRCQKQGDVVQLAFTIPDGTIVECYGKVAWTNRAASNRPVGVGIRFGVLPRHAKEALDKFIEAGT